MNAALLALEARQLPPAAMCSELLADRERLIEEIAKRDAKIAEYERGLCLAADMITCIAQAKGIE